MEKAYDYRADRERLEKRLDDKLMATLARLPNPSMRYFSAGGAARDIVGEVDICAQD